MNGALSFQGSLSGAQEMPATATDASGLIKLNLDATHTRLTYTVTHTIRAPMAAHIHKAQLGSSGAVVFTLKAESGASDTIQLNADQAADLQAGAYYFNVHTAELKDGEARAQILGLDTATQGSGTTKFAAVLSGLQVNPPVASVALGSAELTLDEKTGEVNYSIKHNLVAGTAASVKAANFGVNGEVAFSLSTGAVSQQLAGKLTLSPEQRIQMKSGLLYLEVQTAALPTGELRGQILPTIGQSTALPFSVALKAAPLVTTTAKGMGYFFLNPDRTKLSYRLAHDVSGATSASIVKDGLIDDKVVCQLSSGTDRAQGICEVKASGGDQDLLVSDLLDGKLALVVATQAHAKGELRSPILVPKSL